MRTRNFIQLFAVLIVSLAVYQIVRQLYAPYWHDLADTSFGVLAGTPQWIAYQNRLLAPALVKLISLTGISNVSSLKIFVLLVVLAQGFLLYVLLTKNSFRQDVLSAILVYFFIFLSIQEYSLYPWDFLDAIVFTLFVWGVFQRKPLFFFLILFLFAITNRESALFISLYLMLDAFEVNPSAPRGGKIALSSNAKLITGILLTAVGILYVTAIREILFISQPGGFLDSKHALVGNHINLGKNLFDLFVGNFSSFHFMNSVFIVGSALYILSFARRYTDPQQLKAGILFLLILANILIFGVVNESRLYVILIPFLIFFPQNSMERPA